ncbi:gap junction beta-3 protein-like [Elgaria multicarinata webbii]|uniref:gap junction beta-3 protein-like n=1 Tax=Elgaria multicarinata webbii TaxID=159646 RepID=UPI002FCD2A6C
METEAFAALLSGTSGQVPRLCRAGLTLLTALRLGTLALGAETLWRDETADLWCDDTSRSCLLACFNEAFPISPFNLFLLHMATVLAHGLACAFLFRPPDCQGKGLWWHGRLRGKSQQWRLHLINLVAKILLESVFLMAFHSLYGRYPAVLHCPLSVSCPKAAFCTIRQAAWKHAFNLFVAGMSWLSVTLCLAALRLAVCGIANPITPSQHV